MFNEDRERRRDGARTIILYAGRFVPRESAKKCVWKNFGEGIKDAQWTHTHTDGKHRWLVVAIGGENGADGVTRGEGKQGGQGELDLAVACTRTGENHLLSWLIAANYSTCQQHAQPVDNNIVIEQLTYFSLYNSPRTRSPTHASTHARARAPQSCTVSSLPHRGEP